MPKSTFFKISKEKQYRIMEAASNEFMTVPYSQVSINKIIKNADIPRGSFYQYFEGKEDLFELLVHEHISQMFKALVGEIEKFNGDIFACIEHHIDKMVECGCSDNSGHIKMLFADHQTFEIIWRSIIKEECNGVDTDSILGYIDTTKLDVKDNDELMHLLDILGIVIRDTMCKLFLGEKKHSEEKKREILYAKVASLKKHYSK